jgi:hypothetical protein
MVALSTPIGSCSHGPAASPAAAPLLRSLQWGGGNPCHGQTGGGELHTWPLYTEHTGQNSLESSTAVNVVEEPVTT